MGKILILKVLIKSKTVKFINFIMAFLAMNKHNILVSALVLLLFTSQFLIKTTYSAPLELSYDDGEFDYGWSNFYPYAAAVKFSPPSSSWKVTAVRLHGICFLRGSSIFYVQLWDKNLNIKYSAFFYFEKVFKNATLDWYFIEIPNVVVSGDFYVVVVPMFTLDGTQLWLSVDSDLPISNNSYIVDASKHKILVSLNATSSRPGDFMIRVEGEYVPPPPEIKLSSLEVNENEIVAYFTYPGEIRSTEARLIRQDGSFIELNTSKEGENIVVRVSDQGTLNVFIVTQSSEIIGTSVVVENNLKMIHRNLMMNYTILKEKLNETSEQLRSLAKENEDLRSKVRDAGYYISKLENQVNELADNVTRQNGQISKLNRTIEELQLKNKVLILLLVVLSIVLAVIKIKK